MSRHTQQWSLITYLADNVGSLETKSQPIAGNHVRNNEQADLRNDHDNYK